MKKIILLSVLANLLILGNPYWTSAQSVGVSGFGLVPNASALLDVDASGMTPKGVLIPRITLTSATDATTITSPATSLLVYNTGTSGLSPAGYYYNQGLTGSPNWIPFLTNNVNTPSAWSLIGNIGTTASVAAYGAPSTNNFIGTKDTKDFVFASNNLERMRITSVGDIGIGTQTPEALLDVRGGTTFGPTTNRLGVGGSGVGAGQKGLWINYGSQAADQVTIQAEHQGTAYRPILLNPLGGSIGIYTTTPRANFAISGTPDPSDQLVFYPSANNTFAIQTLIDSKTIGEYPYGAGNNVLSLQPLAGFVGIGCATPRYKLHVGGDILSEGILRATSATVSTIYTACSDIRYKKDITPLPNSLSKVMQLQGVNYFWKTKEFRDKGFPDTKQIGLIAQEIEKIFPEVVLTDKDGYKSVDYSRLTPILVEAIKEQQKIIDFQASEFKNFIINAELRISKLEALISKTVINKAGAKIPR